MDREPRLERELVDIACRAAALPRDLGLNEFAEQRIAPGPIVTPRDWDRETREELADARNYLVWGIVEIYSAFLAGDGWAQDLYERRMRVLRVVVIAWHELHRDAA